MIAARVSEKYLNSRFCRSTLRPRIRFRNFDMSLWPLSSTIMPGLSSLCVIRPTPTRPSAMSG